MDKQVIKTRFINAVIEIGAEKGIDAITRRSVVEVSGVNQLYLYREFKDIYDLQMQAFLYVNRVFVGIALKAVEIFDDEKFTPEKEKKFFNSIWGDMKENAKMFEFFLRYYYNYIFPNYYASEDTQRDLEPLLQKMKHLFKPDVNLVRIILHLLEDFTKYAVLVRSGEYEDNEETDELVYRMAMRMLTPYVIVKPFAVSEQ